MSLINISVVLFFVISLILCLGLWFFFQLKKPFAIWGRKGIMIFKLDPLTRNVLPYKLDQIYDKRLKFKFFKNQTRANASNILKLFGLMNNNPQGNKLFRQALHDIGNGQEEVKYSFIARNMKLDSDLTKINFDVAMHKIVDVSDYLIIINWKVLLSSNQKNLDLKLSNMDQVIEKPANFKGFITFDLNPLIPAVQEKFLQEINLIKSIKKYDIFNWTNLTIVVCYAKNYKKIKKLTTNLIKQIDAKKRKISLGQFIKASGAARFQGISNKKDMNKALATLNFITNLSLKWNEPFIDLRTAQNFKPEFITFNEASRVFRDAIRSHNFNQSLISIKSRKSQKKVIDYLVMDLDKFDKYEIKNILLSNYNVKTLIDANLEKFLSIRNFTASNSSNQKSSGEILKSSNSSKSDSLVETNYSLFTRNYRYPILIDVNASWLINNFSSIKITQDIYIIKLDNYTNLDLLEVILKELKDRKINIGLRVDEFSEFFITFCQNIKPSVVIIDQKIIQENSFNNIMYYTKILSFKEIFEKLNIKVIFENLSPQITNEIANNLGIDYYYTF